MSNNLAPVIEELRRAFTELKPTFDEVFGDRYVLDNEKGWITVDKPTVHMPMPVITVQARGRKKVDGWYKPAIWQDPAADAVNALVKMGGNTKQAASTDEICIAAEALDKPAEEILLTLTGQMIHHYARHNDKGVLQNENGYHSKRFQHMASMLGIKAEQDGSRGYAKLELYTNTVSNQLTETFKKIALDQDIFDMHRKGLKPEDVFKGSKIKKWTCGCTNIRAAVFVEATCKICGNDFVYADKDKDDDYIKTWLQSEADQLDWNENHRGSRAAGRKAQ